MADPEKLNQEAALKGGFQTQEKSPDDLLERAEAMARNHEIDQDPMQGDMRAVGMDVN